MDIAHRVMLVTTKCSFLLFISSDCGIIILIAAEASPRIIVDPRAFFVSAREMARKWRLMVYCEPRGQNPVTNRIPCP